LQDAVSASVVEVTCSRVDGPLTWLLQAIATIKPRSATIGRPIQAECAVVFIVASA
jgi:hypothetical protein